MVKRKNVKNHKTWSAELLSDESYPLFSDDHIYACCSKLKDWDNFDRITKVNIKE